jgi:serine/threonine protein kinase
MTIAAGSRLGPYEIIAPLGAGGVSEVYRARDPRLGRDVAIKVIADADGSADQSGPSKESEYVVPAARLSVHLGLKDVAGVRTALAACVDGGATPFSVISTSRLLIDDYRSDPEIDRLLDRLHDGARPPSDR